MVFSLLGFMVLSLIHFIENGTAGYTDMTCFDMTDDANYARDSLFAREYGYRLAGVALSTYYSNGDRVWQYRFCRPSDGDFYLSSTEYAYGLAVTEYGSSFTRQCVGSSAMYSVTSSAPGNSIYYPLDRSWVWSCATFDSSKYNLTDCAWSGDVNNGHDDFTYECPNNGILYGAYSQLLESRADRKWQFYCCRLQGGSTSAPTSAPTAAPTFHPIVGYTNMTCCTMTEKDAGSYLSVSQSGYLLAGVAYSDHNTSTNDRKWKYRFCRPSDASFSLGNESNLDVTFHGDSFTRQCSGNYQGMSAVHSFMLNTSIYGTYDDREWLWFCTTFNSTYRLTDCAWSGYVNDYHDDFTYECPNNGILHGVKSEMNVTLDDRKWNFRCCRMKGGSISDATSAPTDPTCPTTTTATSDPTTTECKKTFKNNANNDGEEYAGQATSMEECMQLVQDRCGWANIANVQSKVDDLREGEAAECWCQNGDDSTPDNSSYWLNCWFGESVNYWAREPTNSTRESTASTRGESIGHVVMAAVILVICCSV